MTYTNQVWIRLPHASIARIWMSNEWRQMLFKILPMFQPVQREGRTGIIAYQDFFVKDFHFSQLVSRLWPSPCLFSGFPGNRRVQCLSIAFPYFISFFLLLANLLSWLFPRILERSFLSCNHQHSFCVSFNVCPNFWFANGWQTKVVRHLTHSIFSFDLCAVIWWRREN